MKYTQELVSTMYDLYINKKYTYPDLIREFNICEGSLVRVFKKAGFKTRSESERRRVYKINENFFDEIDTEEKAYFLGLLYADGHNNTNNNCIRLTLQDRDKEIVIKLNSLIHPDKPIKFTDSSKQRAIGKNWRDYYGVSIVNKHMSERLVKLGCTSKKSLTLTFPSLNQVPEHLIQHFIRGYFDGDGSVSYPTFSIVGTPEFLEIVQKYFLKIYSFTIKKLVLDKRCQNLVALCYSSKKEVPLIYDWLYKDATIFFERKKIKFEEIIIKMQTKNEFAYKRKPKVTENK